MVATGAAAQPVSATAAATGPSDQLGQLSTALAPALKDVKLDAPAADFGAGRPGQATVTLPASLLDSIQSESAKVGLSKAARHVSVAARLSADGYDITPNGDQTARLAAGQPTTFTWRVKPSAPIKAAMSAEVDGVLTGEGQAKTFPLVKVMLDIAPPAPAPSGFKLPSLSKLGSLRLSDLKTPDITHLNLKDLAIPGRATINVPGLGETPSEELVTAGILFLILVLLVAIARNAARRKARAERRRRFRTFEATGFGDEPGH